MPEWLEWLNSNWFAIVGPVLIFVAFWVGGLWLRRVGYDAFRRWARKASWRGRWLVVEVTYSPFIQWALLLGLHIAITVSILPSDSKTVISKLAVSLFVFSLAWMLTRLTEGMLRLYLPQIRQYIARTKAPQLPAPVLLNGARVIWIALGLLVLFNIWDAPDASGILVLAAVIVVITLVLRDALTGVAKKSNLSHKTRRRLVSTGKLLLILVAIAGLAEVARRGYLVLARQASSDADIMIFLLLIGALILVVSALRSRRFRRIKPSFRAVLLPVLAITLVCAFAGIEPLASYKDTTVSALGQGWHFVTSATRGDVATAVARVEPAVVRVETEHSGGSGVIIDKSGYVLTCNHVVEDAESATIVFMDGQHREGSVIERDAARDLAIIRITPSVSGLSAVTLGDSDSVKSGDDVVAIGYSLGLEGRATISRGVVSAFRTSGGVDYVQTDAAINPGNSGGPLINLKGEVIGIANFKLVHETVEGMGFAIAINQAKAFVSSVKEAEAARTKIETLEREVLTLVNQERLSRGTTTLVWDEVLRGIAREHSAEMARRGELFHSSMYEPYAENCWGGGAGSLYHNTAGDIVRGWMGSPPHRTWLLCPRLRHVGVGIAMSDKGMYASWTFWRSETSPSHWWYVDTPDSPPDWLD